MSVPLTVIRKHDLDKCQLPNSKYQYFNSSSAFRVNTAHDKSSSLKGCSLWFLGMSHSWWNRHIGLIFTGIYCGHTVNTETIFCSVLNSDPEPLILKINHNHCIEWSCRRKSLLWSQSHIFTGGVLILSNLVSVKSTLWFNFIIVFFSLGVSQLAFYLV